MSDLSRSAGGWAGSAFSGSLSDPETSHLRSKFEQLFDNPGLAHTQYYQEPLQTGALRAGFHMSRRLPSGPQPLVQKCEAFGVW